MCVCVCVYYNRGRLVLKSQWQRTKWAKRGHGGVVLCGRKEYRDVLKLVEVHAMQACMLLILILVFLPP